MERIVTIFILVVTQWKQLLLIES